ncbi:MAG TPA: M56 family metallopeptidase [Steroidobacteraceae bacterium]|nr:M56 family metallopeptidase [Steroidobacteraceae bacterium]
MGSAALQQLAALTWLTTLAALLVATARSPLRGMLGPRAAYWLWLAVPASAVALLLPHAAQPGGKATAVAEDVFSRVLGQLDALLAALHVSGPRAAAAFAVWTVGAIGATALVMVRQRAFVRSLGRLVPAPDGTWRSGGVVEPMLIGALRPRVLLPLDFEQRYTAEEREFVLAHEHAHMRRGDMVVNAVGAAWLCVFWFNPVMFWAMRLLRFDQDLACDAAVLAAAGKARRGRYAGALLKAQLSAEALPLPLACHWRSVHPLRRRIAALRRPVAGRLRHGIGMVLVALLVASAGIAASAVQPDLQSARPVASLAANGAAPAAAVHSAGKVCPLALRRARARRQAQSRG